MKQLLAWSSVVAEVPPCRLRITNRAEARNMLEVTPILKNGRAEIQLRNGGKSAIVVNILMSPEGHRRSIIHQLL
jgi:hypothetical protein